MLGIGLYVIDDARTQCPSGLLFLPYLGEKLCSNLMDAVGLLVSYTNAFVYTNAMLAMSLPRIATFKKYCFV